MDADEPTRQAPVPRTSSGTSARVTPFPQPLPDDFILTKARATVAIGRGITAHQEIRDVFEKFRLHHKAKGMKSPDWNAAWELWCIRHQDFKKQDEQKRQTSRPAI